jgi:hypothetical protein
MSDEDDPEVMAFKVDSDMMGCAIGIVAIGLAFCLIALGVGGCVYLSNKSEQAHTATNER